MRPFENFNDLANQLSSDLAELETQTVNIGVDGMDGSGKTWLANTLGSFLDVPVVSLDDFVEKNKGGYVPFLRKDEIRQRLTAGEPVMIVEGVCLLAVAEQSGFKVDKLIYVKRMDSHGNWQDAEECDHDQNSDETIDKLTNDLRKFAEIEQLLDANELGGTSDNEVDLTELLKEVIRYHAKYKPVEKANYVFHSVNDLPQTNGVWL